MGACSVRGGLLTNGGATAAGTKTLPRVRIQSLDWARGWMLVASVSVNSWILMPAWFNHSPWFGVHPIDFIFPMFVTLAGVGLAFANGRKLRVKATIRRFVVLMVAGLLYNAVTEWKLDVLSWRVTGVLQLYAVVIVLISLMHLVTRTWQGWAAITVLLTLIDTSVLSLYARACPGGVLTPECNPSGALDTWLFGASHIYRLGGSGHDPEGLIVILGAMVSTSAGVTVGHLLRRWSAKSQETGAGPATSVVPMLAASIGFFLLSLLSRYTIPVLLGVYLPTMKRLWTPTFALSIAAGVTVLLLAGHLLLDRRSVPKVVENLSYPFVSLGRNSLLVYFGSHVLVSLLSRSFTGEPSVAVRFIDAFPTPAVGQVVFTALSLAFWIVLAMYLHRKKIYIRA